MSYFMRSTAFSTWKRSRLRTLSWFHICVVAIQVLMTDARKTTHRPSEMSSSASAKPRLSKRLLSVMDDGGHLNRNGVFGALEEVGNRHTCPGQVRVDAVRSEER